MMEPDPSSAEEARMFMQGRLLRCPLEDNPKDCPLCEIRKLPLEERITWLASKSDIEVVELYHQHTDCLKYKLSFQSN